MAAPKDKIVFLDAGTVDYGDLSLKKLSKLGRLTAYTASRPQDIVKRAAGATHLITNKCRLDRKILGSLKSVRSVNISATGTNIVDLEAAREYGMAVTNVAGYSTESVVQFTIGFLLSLFGNLWKLDRAAHEGKWSRSPFFMWNGYPVREVAAKTLGIIGYGDIGRRVGEAARALGMKVVAAQIPGRSYSPHDKVPRMPLVKLLKTADAVTIHAPLTDLTRSLIGAAALRKMKKGAFLINMARGGIVDEKALFAALKRGHLAGAATDVLTQEPPPRNHILLGAPNLLITPHMAWASLEARTRLVEELYLNIQAFQQGRKRNRIL